MSAMAATMAATPLLAEGDSFEVAQLCARLATHYEELGSLAAEQVFERVDRERDWADLKKGAEVDFRTALIVLGPNARKIISADNQMLHDFEVSVMKCVSLKDCDPTSIKVQASQVRASLIDACRLDYEGNE